MEEDLILDDFEEAISGINDNNLVYTIWTRPRDTFKYIFRTNPEKNVLQLIILGGAINGLNKAAEKANGINLDSFTTLLTGLLAGAALGWIIYYIFAWGVSATGKWFNGQATPSEIRTIFGWSVIPQLLTVLFIIPDLYFLESGIGDVNINEYLEKYESINVIVIISIFFQFVLGLWSTIILIIGISQVQNFSIGKSILNYILPVLIVVIPLFIIIAGLNLS
jgi:hypothetical protein